MEGILNIVHRNGAVVKSEGQADVSTEQNNIPEVLAISLSHNVNLGPSTDHGSKSLVNKLLC